MPLLSLCRWVVAFVLVAILSVAAHAQGTGVTLQIRPEYTGLAGVLRPRTWTPLLATVSMQGGTPRRVLVQWRLSDFDGDHVTAERMVTLNPGVDHNIWLYAMPPVNIGDRQTWTIQVVDAASTQLLATQVITPMRRESTKMTFIGVLGSAGMGLDPYTNQYTQHEPIGIVRGLSLETLPDRWYGLDLLHSLIWVSDGGDPNAAAIQPAMHAALREWVRRGGHLIIVMPAYAEPWSGSPLADLLPVTATAMRRVQESVPRFLWDVRPTNVTEVQMTAFDVPDGSGVSIIERTDGGEALIIAKRYGFGRVTLMGVDLNDPRLARLGVPQGKVRVWNTIYGWNSEVLSETAAQAMMRESRLSRVESRMPIELGHFIPGQIAMTGQAAPMLLLAILVFVVYWLAAGPLGFAVLKNRGKTRQSWLVFVGTVAVFSAVAWGGAWVLQPRSLSVAHFSVLDMEARTGLVRTQSWISLFVPEFGRVEVALAPDQESDVSHNTLWSPGLVAGPDAAGFPDPQLYVMDSGSPSEVAAGAAPDRDWPVGLPVRATAKQFEVRYMGALGEGVRGIADAWVPPQGTVRIGDDGFPSGTLAHKLPGELKNVLAVYVPRVTPNPGETSETYRRRATPWVWRIGAWPANTPMELELPPQLRTRRDKLVERLPDYSRKRGLNNEGLLGVLMGGTPMFDTDSLMAMHLATDQKVKFIEMLSFYDSLPPPDVYQDGGMMGLGPAVYQRSLGRSLDITPHITGAKLILIGHMEGGPLPAPLFVDGEPVERVDPRSWTVVRWIYDL